MNNDSEEGIAGYVEMDDARVTFTVFSIGLYRYFVDEGQAEL
jgi:hypothetical protein